MTTRTGNWGGSSRTAPSRSGTPRTARASPDAADALRKLVDRWTGVKARERANYQLYLGELCSALGVEGPRPAGSGYEYEYPIKVVDRDGKDGSNFVDLFKRDHFILEAKGFRQATEASRPVVVRSSYSSYVANLSTMASPTPAGATVSRCLRNSGGCKTHEWASSDFCGRWGLFLVSAAEGPLHRTVRSAGRWSAS